MERQEVVEIQPEVQNSDDVSNFWAWGLENSNGTVYAAVDVSHGSGLFTLYSMYLSNQFLSFSWPLSHTLAHMCVRTSALVLTHSRTFPHVPACARMCQMHTY